MTVGLLLALIASSGQNQRGGVGYRIGLPSVMSVLSRAHVSGSLEYWGVCDTGLDFPKLQSPQNIAVAPVDALREIFANNPDMQVKEGPHGIIRMVERDVPEDLPALKIKRISFGGEYLPPNVIYDPGSALRVILSTPEVVAFMKAHDLGPPHGYQTVIEGQSLPSLESPRISGNLNNVTLSEALDYVLRTFPGLWIYENCPSDTRNRSVLFVFYQNGPEWSLVWK
jgi:hypothetical protein